MISYYNVLIDHLYAIFDTMPIWFLCLNVNQNCFCVCSVKLFISFKYNLLKIDNFNYVFSFVKQSFHCKVFLLLSLMNSYFCTFAFVSLV